MKPRHKKCKYGACSFWNMRETRCGYFDSGYAREKHLKKLHKKAWDIQSEYIRRSERGICFTCGQQNDWKECDAGHFKHGHEFDFVKNAIHCQCVYCNKYKSGNAAEYMKNMLDLFGEAEVLRIQSFKGKAWILSEERYMDIIADYKARLKREFD